MKIDSAGFKRTMAQKHSLVKANVVAILRNEAIPHLIDLIMKGYDELSDRADLMVEDPTNPSNWRAEFLTKLREDFEQNMLVTNKGVIIRIGDKEFLGYGKENSTDDSPLVWLVYYLEGLAGEWAFITPELYEQFRGAGKYDPKWGRFGEGFMIDKESYEMGGWHEVVPFEMVRHPFSGYSPVDIFTEALREFRLRPFLEKAIKAAAEGRKL